MVDAGESDRTIRVLRRFEDQDVSVVLRRSRPVEEADGRYPPLEPATIVADGIRLDRDVAVPLRDGVVVYVDIYRPDTTDPVPAITAWSPFGKRCGERGMALPRGVPAGTLSSSATFEAADPDYWCRNGYAVVNTDARGVANSEGDIEYWSRSEGKDFGDVIDWIGDQAWCTGKVGLSGNSWLAITQWFGAAERPRHLAAIAPWEGVSDFYRDMAMRGGIPEQGFTEFLITRMFGRGYVDDVTANALEHPFIDAYWREKAADLANIEVPAYVTAGWSALFHLPGSMRAFRAIPGERKWLRTHRDSEWPDYYSPQNVRDLQLFFDRYLKDIHNGWELTPRVRIDVMDRADYDWETNRPERDFPLVGTSYQRHYLDSAESSLSPEASEVETSASYDAASGRLVFRIVFTEETEVTGYLSARLWIEADGANDADLFLAVQKVDENGNVVSTLSLGDPQPGAVGLLRASHRELDTDLSTEFEPVQLHQRELLLSPGEVVPVDISIQPTSRIWHAGETLQLVVSGHDILKDDVIEGELRQWDWYEQYVYLTRNVGRHIIHTGGRYDSYLQLPVIPARRTS